MTYPVKVKDHSLMVVPVPDNEVVSYVSLQCRCGEVLVECADMIDVGDAITNRWGHITSLRRRAKNKVNR